MIYAMRTQNNRTMAGELLNGGMLSLIAGCMNGERPNLICRVQYLCEVFVGHHLQIKSPLIKGHTHHRQGNG